MKAAGDQVIEFVCSCVRVFAWLVSFKPVCSLISFKPVCSLVRLEQCVILSIDTFIKTSNRRNKRIVHVTLIKYCLLTPALHNQEPLRRQIKSV